MHFACLRWSCCEEGLAGPVTRLPRCRKFVNFRKIKPSARVRWLKPQSFNNIHSTAAVGFFHRRKIPSNARSSQCKIVILYLQKSESGIEARQRE